MSYAATFLRRVALYSVCAVAVGISASILVTLASKNLAYRGSTAPAVTPFPIGVDPSNATITEQHLVDDFYDAYLAQTVTTNDSLLAKVGAMLQTNQLYQQLASPVSRVYVVWPGERTEEAIQNVGDVLRWNSTQRTEFAELMQANDLEFTQGVIPPGKYVTHREASPADIAQQLQENFALSVTDRYTPEVEQVISLEDTLIIASLIEREARDFENMREISGVIWNRLFIDMPLQLDASLQYVKANNPYEASWWPAIRPQDKFIDSSFNTYQNKGLPPEPIANPSVEAIVAALNPRITDCVYYFHSATRDYYCSITYQEHVRKLKEVYGQ